MDGHSQMVFCAHLSYTADRERGKSENQKEKKEREKRCLLIAKISTLLPRTHFYCANLPPLVLHRLLSVPFQTEWF